MSPESPGDNIVSLIKGKMETAIQECGGDAHILSNSFREISRQVEVLESQGSIAGDEASDLLKFINGLRSFLPSSVGE